MKNSCKSSRHPSQLLALSDCILVMSDGRIQGELTGPDMTQKNILTLATQERGPKKMLGSPSP